MALAMKRTGAPDWLRIAIDVGAVLGLGSVVLVQMLGQSRVFYAMSRDGLLGAWFSKVHPKFRTPYLSTIFTGCAVSVAAGLLPLQILGQLVNIGTLLAFALVCAGVIILRKKRPDLERPFRVPFMPVVPIMGIAACIGLMLTLPVDTWLRLAIWLLIGFGIYFTYGVRHSRLRMQSSAPGH
jgi:APA family basic amino acid/polyamine antiporter